MDCYKVIRKWETNYPDPIKLAKSEAVIIEKKEIKNKKWAGWIWCESEVNSGWVPQKIIVKISDREGIISEDYSAKELNVSIGEKVKGLRELNGWIWVKRDLNNKEGWLPREILQKITDSEMNIDKMKIEDRKDFEPPTAVAKWGWKCSEMGLEVSPFGYSHFRKKRE